MDATKYEKAIKACDLDKDINSFDHGDETKISQRGLNMSGGQKQRIQLVRAVYNDADIYLLDDPFSAVDAHTAAILFNECIMAALAHKTVILVTHQVEFLSEVDKILVMEARQITQSGSNDELLTSRTTFEQLINAHKNAITILEFSNDEQLAEEEETEISDVGWKPFVDNVLASKWNAPDAASTYWLALGIRIPNIGNTLLIEVYTAISTLNVVFVYLRSFCAAPLGLKASKALFAGFTNSIFNAPMLFFDSTPVGRILTQASSYFSVVDFNIRFSIILVVAADIELITTIGIMASVT
ncbi:hypothetical protein PVL29_019492 [Vitis rotundifolia]|uniref:ABC transmembrane type-1 domain-containing protein n=1 Tax=Vitis rotundifolia TaxID=103349 RepID=A0AA38Z1E7_VITRO|nr:hypothetical protein PVL29_019492 [Vitis rotundifolia]